MKQTRELDLYALFPKYIQLFGRFVAWPEVKEKDGYTDERSDRT